ncbi:Hypothetical predicted protein [Octopus vulgaris]|uniref:Uncharacterized protein n=1 Tax=Octopus vulgaris TaxID=6645 RepID=A0AA36AGA2_OCTVU|nr:Hypothetical predicted protein [Octopus vulgaris]
MGGRGKLILDQRPASTVCNKMDATKEPQESGSSSVKPDDGLNLSRTGIESLLHDPQCGCHKSHNNERCIRSFIHSQEIDTQGFCHYICLSCIDNSIA